MRPSLLALLLLLPVVSRAGDLQSTPRDSQRPHASRRLLFQPFGRDDEAPLEVFVAKGVPTIIRTPWALHARGTGLAGRCDRRDRTCDRPVEVLTGRDMVIVKPTRALDRSERFPFVVRLNDETAVPLVLTPAPAGKQPDGEVVLALDTGGPEELRIQLAAMTDHARTLGQQLQQALQEQDSADFALAGLLAGGRAPLTAFAKTRERSVAGPLLLNLMTFAPPRHASSRVAVVISVTNDSDEPMELAAGRLFSATTLSPLGSTVRVSPRVIAPGRPGSISVVLDRESFGPDGGEKVVLELLSRRGATPGAPVSIELGTQDFEPQRWRF